MLLTVVIVLAVLGLALYVLERTVKMDAGFQTAIRAVIGIGFLLWLLYLARIGAFRV